MNPISTEAKVGLFILIALIILAYMSFRVGQYGFGIRGGYTVSAVFDNVAGLEKGSSVQMAGVDIGKVEDIRLENGRARVTVRINPDVKLQRDVRAAIRTHGILGDKYIEIFPGAAEGAYLHQGDQIVQTERQADIDRLLNQVTSAMEDIKKVTTSLGNTFGGPEGEEALRRILTNVRDLSENLNRVVVQNDEKFNQLVENLHSASREMDRTFANLSNITGDLKEGKGTMGALLKDRALVDNLNKTLASLEEISTKINEGRGTIGKLINDEETVNNLNESLAGINRYVTKAEQFRTFINYRGEYLFDGSNAKSYLELRIQPREDKFYLLGINTDPRGKRTLTETTTTVGGVTTSERREEYNRDKFLFSVQIGKRFKDLVLRGGLFESTGGVGLDYFTLNNKLRFTFEAFDFDPDRNPHLKAYAEYRLMKHLYVSGGWDNPIQTGQSSPFVGFSIKFEDEDLKYLLTSTPIPR